MPRFSIKTLLVFTAIAALDVAWLNRWIDDIPILAAALFGHFVALAATCAFYLMVKRAFQERRIDATYVAIASAVVAGGWMFMVFYASPALIHSIQDSFNTTSQGAFSVGHSAFLGPTLTVCFLIFGLGIVACVLAGFAALFCSPVARQFAAESDQRWQCRVQAITLGITVASLFGLFIFGISLLLDAGWEWPGILFVGFCVTALAVCYPFGKMADDLFGEQRALARCISTDNRDSEINGCREVVMGEQEQPERDTAERIAPEQETGD